MATLVVIDTQTGSLTRVEIGGSAYRKTHYAVPKDGPAQLSPTLVEQFRLYPDPEFSLDPPPRPVAASRKDWTPRIIQPPAPTLIG